VLSDKNRRTIYDYDLAKGIKRPRHASSSSRPIETPAPPKIQEPVTHQTVLKQLVRIRKQVDAVSNKAHIKHAELFKALNTCLSLANIELLRSSGDKLVPRRAIDEVFLSARWLSVEYLDRITVKLIKVAGSDNEKIVEIHQFNRQTRRKALINKYLPAATISAIIILMAIIINSL
jgi:hypothetical protein